MSSKKKEDIIYYDDKLQDEFSTAKITAKPIGEDYVYIRDSFFGKLAHFFWYRIVAIPLATIYLKLKFSHKIVNRKLLRDVKGGFFIYGNHTQAVGDALIPTMICRPRSTYVIVHSNNVSMPYLGRVTPYLGALPLPDNFAASRHFSEAIKKRLSENCPICIYPEAHIWPYYTEIREFADTSFSYPVMLNAPVYCFTNTYQKIGRNKKIRIITYIDGPFTADSSVSSKEARIMLHGKVLETMKKRAENSNVQKIRYVHRGEE